MFLSLQMTIVCAVLAASEQQSMSLFRLFLRGGALMWVLLALSILAIYLIGKKWWSIRKAGKAGGNFMGRIRNLILAGKYGDAKNLCRRTDYAMARLIETGMGKIGSPLDDIHAAVENRGSAEIAKLEKGLPTLATIAGGAPMIGFLGTVVGMVQAFFNMSNAGNNIDITMLSGGIYVAMMTTVGGLIVGIIAYFGYNYLSSEISSLVTKLEGGTFEFIEIVKESGNKVVKK
ncbi:MAG: MotA/TolQ/ExbB proton channel family protein [Bacteroidales bacterium]|nr:MotA/TolQ/ExbB proton channel family protein [Bacteroidales bacterium]